MNTWQKKIKIELVLKICTKTKFKPEQLRYIDDTITAAVHENKNEEFHKHLNKQNTSIQFTKEIKENGKMPFLDCLVICENNTLRTTLYRKPLHTDRLLDQMSYNPISHKGFTVMKEILVIKILIAMMIIS